MSTPGMISVGRAKALAVWKEAKVGEPLAVMLPPRRQAREATQARCDRNASAAAWAVTLEARLEERKMYDEDTTVAVIQMRREECGTGETADISGGTGRKVSQC